MTQDDILRWAEEAGASSPLHCTVQLEDAAIIRFACLVRSSALEEAAAMCESQQGDSILRAISKGCASAIRALKQGSDSGHSPALAGEASTGSEAGFGAVLGKQAREQGTVEWPPLTDITKVYDNPADLIADLHISVWDREYEESLRKPPIKPSGTMKPSELAKLWEQAEFGDDLGHKSQQAYRFARLIEQWHGITDSPVKGHRP
jgi:hypothetical protein